MIDRLWNPKPMPDPAPSYGSKSEYPEPWDNQLAVLVSKNCDCLDPTNRED